MCTSRAAGFLVVLLVSSLVALASAQWLTLSAKEPIVVARGGFSGMFPDSSTFAYNFALSASVPNVVVWCDVQLTKDAIGICAPDIRLDNSTSISGAFQDKKNTYVVNGVSMEGWFSIDFTIKDLSNIYLTQGISSRSTRFDGNFLPVLTVDDVVNQVKPPGLWLNIQHDQFFSQHNLSMRSYVISTIRSVPVNYISSPEVNFLKSIVARTGTNIKLIFRFLAQDTVEPSTNQTYGSLLKNLSTIKTFASGILIPKTYIWPITSDNYLLPHTSVVLDAHKIGLEVYASEFINDLPLSYNYSYDPIRETLQYIDNGQFSVDGLLTDFPITQSEAIGCFAQLGKNNSGQATPLVISFNGASGDYPSCTTIAYTSAIQDGADVIDCPVQISKDGVPFCFRSVNLMDGSNVAQSPYRTRTSNIPELFGSGIYSFSLTWSEIQSLTPQISSPYSVYTMFRNPRAKNEGHFVSLSDFLDLAKNTSLYGVLLRVENATYLAEEQGLDVTGAVLDVLSKAGYGNQTTMKIMIQSTNSSVLTKIKGSGSNYQLVYEVDETIRDATNSTVEDIKSFAHSVAVYKTSVLPTTQLYLTTLTGTVAKLHTFNLTVYVQVFSNEFVSQAWDFFSDPTVEINTFFLAAEIDGVITEFPKTSAAYRKNKCLGLGDNTPAYMTSVQPGSLLTVIPTLALPPALAPLSVLDVSDVNEPPLPAVPSKAPSPSPGTTTTNTTPAASAPKSDGQPRFAVPLFVSGLPVLLASLFLLL